MEAPIREHASTLPWPPLRDIFGNPFVTIVDASGIHHVPVVGCSCDRQDPNIDIAYLKMGLFATSFERIQTVFTFEVLKDFRLSNLECKTTAYQYYQKLRRLTCPEFPKAVLNRYRELRRLSREYRNLKLWKIHGEVRGLCYGVKREAASRSGTSQNPQNTNTKSNTNPKTQITRSNSVRGRLLGYAQNRSS